MAISEQSSNDIKHAKSLLNKLGETFKSFHSHASSISTLGEQWRTLQNSFVLVHNSLDNRVKELEAKERENAIRFYNLQKEFEFRERLLKEAVDAKENEMKNWREAIEERCKAVEVRENRCATAVKAVEMEAKKVEERCQAVDAKENEMKDRCKAVEVREERCAAVEAEAKEVEERCRVVEEKEKKLASKEEDMDEMYSMLELKEKELHEGNRKLASQEKMLRLRFEEFDERLKGMELKETEIVERYRVLEEKEKAIKEKTEALDLREKQVDDLSKELELKEKVKEKVVKEKTKALDLREKELNDKYQVLELKEKQVDVFSKELELKEKGINDRYEMLDSKGKQNEERSKVAKMKEKQVDKGLRLKKKELNEQSQPLEKKEKEIHEPCLVELEESTEKHLDDQSQSQKSRDKQISLIDSSIPQVSQEIPHSDVPQVAGVEIRMLCRNMDPHGVRSYLVKHRKELRLMHEELLDALNSAPDPAKLVLDVSQNYYRNFTCRNDAKATKNCCIILLEKLVKLSPPIASNVKDEAKCFADSWKARLKGVDDPEDTYGFLQFLAAFKLASLYDTAKLLSLFDVFYRGDVVYRPEDNKHLCRALGLSKKIPGVVKSLVGRQKWLLALKYICVFKLERDFPPVPLVDAHLELIRRRVNDSQKDGTSRTKIEASHIELDSLKKVVKCVTSLNLEQKSPVDSLVSRIKELEKAVEDKKLSALLQAKKRDASSITYREQLKKRPRVGHDHHSHQVAPRPFLPHRSLLPPNAVPNCQFVNPHLVFGRLVPPGMHAFGALLPVYYGNSQPLPLRYALGKPSSSDAIVCNRYASGKPGTSSHAIVCKPHEMCKSNKAS